MTTIFLAIQDSESRRWSPVAKVSLVDSIYRLVYTQGAWNVPGFSGFSRMQNLEEEYRSLEIFPILKNRTLPRSRPEFEKYLTWLGIHRAEHTELSELARSGGLRATDEIELIPVPEKLADGSFEAYFFARGASHMPEQTALQIGVSDRLYVMRDFQNPKDSAALLLRTGDPISLVGYAPRYYSEYLSQLASKCSPSEFVVSVERVNREAPTAYRILCKVSAPWVDELDAFQGADFKEIPRVSE